MSRRTHGATTDGTVHKKITQHARAAGRTVRADQEDPQCLVRSDRTGRTAMTMTMKMTPTPLTPTRPGADE